MSINKNRKLNRMKDYDYSQNGYYFVTVCTNNKKEYFGNIEDGKMILSKIGGIVDKCWLEIPIHYPNVKLDEYAIMPNHVHGIIIIENDNMEGKRCNSIVGNKNICSLRWQTRLSGSLSSMMRGFKIGVTKWCKDNNYPDFYWQKSFYDHIIRNEESLEKIREYIINNPAKWQLDRNNPENLFM